MKALLIGATGLVGKEILKLALEDPGLTSVDVFVRRPTNLSATGLKEHIVNFDEIDSWKSSLQGDVLFSAMGTTINAAGSQEAQYKVDFTYQYRVAKAARENGVKYLVLISSVGADPGSPFFYLKTKGELEAEVNKLGFEGVTILRPSFLQGEREVPRPGEAAVQFFLGKIPRIGAFARIIPVSARVVAAKALGLAGKVRGTRVLEPRDILF